MKTEIYKFGDITRNYDKIRVPLWERSDIDLAVSGGDAGEFADAVEEEAWTLLMFDVVNLDRGITAELQKEIDRDGVALYEETG